MSTIGEVIRALGLLIASLHDDTERALEGALDALMGRMQAVTPVISGRMKANYYVSKRGAGQWEFGDQMDYAGRVIEQPGFSRQGDALRAVLDEAERDLETTMGVLVERLARRI